MKKKLLLYIISMFFIGIGTASAMDTAKAPKMKMTTDIPEGILTPNHINSRIGELNMEDGVPTVKTSDLIYDNLDFQHGVTSFLSGIQVASMEAMRKGLLTFGPANKTVILFEDLMDSKALWLTPNTTSVYMMMWLQLDDEPYVLETPADVLGIIDDHWFKYVCDFGRMGADKNKGGKFLIVPPGYKGEIPEGRQKKKDLEFRQKFTDCGYTTKVAEKIKEELKAFFGTELASIVLYGSYAEGKESKYTDIDFSVVVTQRFGDRRARRDCGIALRKMLYRSVGQVSPRIIGTDRIFVTLRNFNPQLQNILKHGIPLLNDGTFATVKEELQRMLDTKLIEPKEVYWVVATA